MERRARDLVAGGGGAGTTASASRWRQKTLRRRRRRRQRSTTVLMVAGPVAGSEGEGKGTRVVDVDVNVVAANSRRSMLLGTGMGFMQCCCGNPACAQLAREGENERRRGGLLSQQYDKFQAANLSEGMREYEQSIALMKRRLFGGLAGSEKEGLTIVELGIGAAPNVQYYMSGRVGKGDVYIGVDFNPEMFAYARREIANLDLRGEKTPEVSLIVADVENTGLPDSCADAVIGTLLLCSVEDQSKALKEIRRILKPRGKYYFVEHVGAEPGSVLRVAQDVLNPLQMVLAGGCHLNRDTASAISEAFEDGDVIQYRYNLLPGKISFSNGFELENPEGLNFSGGLISPHISGEATAGDCILTRCKN